MPPSAEPSVKRLVEPVDRWLTFGLAFVGGYGDASGLILAQTFTGHVTGNLVLVAVAIVTRNWLGTVRDLSAIATFLFGIFLSVWVARLLRTWPSWIVLPAVMSIEVLLIGGASCAVWLNAGFGIEIFIICFSLALGLQNGAFRSTGGISVHTTYLTGTITRLITVEADKLASIQPPGHGAVTDPTAIVLSGIWACFVIGAVAGVAMVLRFKALGILGAALILAAMIGRCWLVARRRTSIH